MEKIKEKLQKLSAKLPSGEKIHMAILGLGSVGHYLLEYLVGCQRPNLKIYVLGRNEEKIRSDINITKTAALIRGLVLPEFHIVPTDFGSIESIQEALRIAKPDFIVNSSRAYSGLKYGSISWKNIRAYGLWAPLSIKYIKNIMAAQTAAAPSAIVINTSYSDATNAWLKTAGVAHPDFGSGNLNHLVPRIKMAVAHLLGMKNPEEWSEIEVTMATSHFHDVLISKEGITDGVPPLLHLSLRGEKINLSDDKVYSLCAIGMPTDQKRNMMNASSNFEIIDRCLRALSKKTMQVFHSPGVDGLVGGYPFFVDGRDVSCGIFEKYFSSKDMKEINDKSIYLDGIEGVKSGHLIYTDELLAKVEKAFGCKLPKKVALEDSDRVGDLIIEQIIRPHSPQR